MKHLSYPDDELVAVPILQPISQQGANATFILKQPHTSPKHVIIFTFIYRKVSTRRRYQWVPIKGSNKYAWEAKCDNHKWETPWNCQAIHHTGITGKLPILHLINSPLTWYCNKGLIWDFNSILMAHSTCVCQTASTKKSPIIMGWDIKENHQKWISIRLSFSPCELHPLPQISKSHYCGLDQTLPNPKILYRTESPFQPCLPIHAMLNFLKI